MEIKNPTHEQLNYIRNNYKFSGSFDYKVLGSNVSVEQYIKVV
ncbi:hypothetical protein [Candidatus Sarcina troglodytae]|nr:hypothetical protein [Sarcina sp. JB2]